MKRTSISRSELFRRCMVFALFWVFACEFAQGQYGGRPGDVVLYSVTYNGNSDFQAQPRTAANTASANSAFKIVPLDSVTPVGSDPFPLERRVLYMTNTETFQVGADFETTVGLNRIFTTTTKIFQIEGATSAGGFTGFAPTFLTFPEGLDVTSDIALETLVVITWFPKSWPFIALSATPGPVRPPNVPGFVYLFTTPGLIQLPSLLPWKNFSVTYPLGGWPAGIDFKLLDDDRKIGDVVRLIRLRPGAKTPVFRTAGHTHLFVLYGNAAITPAGGATLPMYTHDYAFLPENFSVSLTNPASYTGPVRK